MSKASLKLGTETTIVVPIEYPYLYAKGNATDKNRLVLGAVWKLTHKPRKRVESPVSGRLAMILKKKSKFCRAAGASLARN